MYHVPNGFNLTATRTLKVKFSHVQGINAIIKEVNQLAAREALKMNNSGLVAGVSDFVLTMPDNTTYHIELKIPSGRWGVKQAWFASVHSDSYFLVDSLEQFQDVIKKAVRAYVNKDLSPLIKVKREVYEWHSNNWLKYGSKIDYGNKAKLKPRLKNLVPKNFSLYN